MMEREWDYVSKVRDIEGHSPPILYFFFFIGVLQISVSLVLLATIGLTVIIDGVSIWQEMGGVWILLVGMLGLTLVAITVTASKTKWYIVSKYREAIDSMNTIAFKGWKEIDDPNSAAELIEKIASKNTFASAQISAELKELARHLTLKARFMALYSFTISQIEFEFGSDLQESQNKILTIGKGFNPLITVSVVDEKFEQPIKLTLVKEVWTAIKIRQKA